MKRFILLAAALLLGGCSSHYRLMPTPEVYALGIKEPFAASLPAQLKSADANIMYVTDRIPEPREDGRLDYGLGRDHSQQLARPLLTSAVTWAGRNSRRTRAPAYAPGP